MTLARPPDQRRISSRTSSVLAESAGPQRTRTRSLEGKPSVKARITACRLPGAPPKLLLLGRDSSVIFMHEGIPMRSHLRAVRSDSIPTGLDINEEPVIRNFIRRHHVAELVFLTVANLRS